MAKIRVLIADDHALLRTGLRLLINAQADMEVVGEAADGHEVLRKAAAVGPDVVTLDLTMPGGSSIKTIELLRQECPRTRVLVLTMHDDPSYVRTALAAGGVGYIVKTAADGELLTAIRAVHRGRTFVDANLTDGPGPGILGSPAGGGKAGTVEPASPLSERELEVLQLLAQGYTNQEIGTRLCLSVKTIETYRARVMDKLGLRSRADLTRYALEIGLLGPDKVFPG
jgi:two-component system response regulator NreC